MEISYQEFIKTHQAQVLRLSLKNIIKILYKKVHSTLLRWKSFEPFIYEVIDYDKVSKEAVLNKFQKIVLRKTTKDLKNTNRQLKKRLCLSRLIQNVRILKMRAFSGLRFRIEVLYNSTTTYEIVKNITIVEKYVTVCEHTGDEILMSQKTKTLVEIENEKGEILAPAEVKSEKIEDFFIARANPESNKTATAAETQTEFLHLDFPIIQHSPELKKTNLIHNKVPILQKLLSKLPISAALIILIAFLYKKLKPLMHFNN